MKTLANKTVIPEAGDPILESLETFALSVSNLIPAATLAAAKETLTALEALGKTPTANAPTYFDISGVLYRSVGSKNHLGEWLLEILSGKEWGSTTTNVSGRHNLAQGQAQLVAQLYFPVRAYDRLFEVSGELWGGSVTGNVDLAVRCNETVKLARFPTGEQSQADRTVRVVIPAGTTPNIAMSVRGGGGGGSITLSKDDDWSDLTAVAEPVSMAN